MTKEDAWPPLSRSAVGTAVSVEHVVDEVQMFFFSAATNNGHRIHYDLPYAKEVEGHRGLLVHGPLQAALAQKLVTDWSGPDGRLRRLVVRHHANVHPHDTLRFAATVVERRRDGDWTTVDVDLEGQRSDRTVFLRGTARIAIPE